jgi:hypothetical protein
MWSAESHLWRRTELALKLTALIATHAKQQQGTRTDLSRISGESYHPYDTIVGWPNGAGVA